MSITNSVEASTSKTDNTLWEYINEILRKSQDAGKNFKNLDDTYDLFNKIINHELFKASEDKELLIDTILRAHVFGVWSTHGRAINRTSEHTNPPYITPHRINAKSIIGYTYINLKLRYDRSVDNSTLTGGVDWRNWKYPDGTQVTRRDLTLAARNEEDRRVKHPTISPEDSSNGNSSS